MISVIHSHEKSFTKQWSNGLLDIPGATSMYTHEIRSFELEIFSSDLIHDDSFVVMHSNIAVALVPLYRMKGKSGAIEYKYGGEYLRSAIISYEKSSKIYKETVAFIFDHIESLAKTYNISMHKAMIEGVELLEGRKYYNYLTEFGYLDKSTICQLIELTKDEDELWSKVRKSYRPLINRAKKNYSYEVISSLNFEEEKCEEYRKLHNKAAGRQTRSLKSFQLMYELIKKNKGFLIIIRNQDGVCVATHYFSFNGLYALYFSSAIDDEQPSNSGIGQLGVWIGIVTARKLGCHILDMGQLRITDNPTKKEQNIARFKKGFGGKTVTVFRGIKSFN